MKMNKPTIFCQLHKKRNRNQNIKRYLLDNFDVQEDDVDYFLVFLGCTLNDKWKMYQELKSDIKKYEKYDRIDFDQDDNNENLKNDIFVPDLIFENEMRESYNTFINIIKDDNQDYLYHNCKIDDFYRLFARHYNPVF
jgi:hypothetical protein